jgi:dihydrofolate synthase/folylpolyglutamate synthase
MSSIHEKRLAPSSVSEDELYVTTLKRLLKRGGYQNIWTKQNSQESRLRRIWDYLDEHERPDSRHTVHIAGSKGKGSTASIVEIILRFSGATTCLLTSPDLHTTRERIQINGQLISKIDFTRLANQLLDDPVTADWSYFEMMIVLGWWAAHYFQSDWQIVEVGLGGRLDTTNAVLKKEVSVITAIDLEHTDILGSTIKKIAIEKAGIIERSTHLVLASMNKSASDAIKNRSKLSNKHIHDATTDCSIISRTVSLDKQVITLQTPEHLYNDLTFLLLGEHQLENICSGIRAAEIAWREVNGTKLPKKAVFEGLASLTIPGRFEVLGQKPLTITDGLHTPLAAKRFSESLKELDITENLIWIFGFLEGKSISKIIDELVMPADTAIATELSDLRTLRADTIAHELRKRSHHVSIQPDISSSIKYAKQISRPDSTVLIVGSLYTASEARAFELKLTSETKEKIRS